jgi:hypothetical protein
MEQAPRLHDGVPLALLHGELHAPQWATVVFVFTSQPLSLALPSQLPQPALHVMEQVLALQVAEPLAVLQGELHAPQCANVLVVLVSQPLVRAFPSQLPQPAVHVIAQFPALHEAEPLAVLQGMLQPPQCASVVFVLVSHPFVALPSQLPNPALHAIPHVPLVHVAVPPMAGHTCPQVAQLAGLVFVLISQPSVSLPLQFANPALHVPMLHLETAQTPDALAYVQAAPHAPQLNASVRRYDSQPFDGLLSQSP